jgi:hypothetical protein
MLSHGVMIVPQIFLHHKQEGVHTMHERNKIVISHLRCGSYDMLNMRFVSNPSCYLKEDLRHHDRKKETL